MPLSNVDTVLVSIFSGQVVIFMTLLGYILKKLGQHDTALAVLIQSVNPPGDKSLRSLIQEIQLEQAKQQIPNREMT